MAVKVECPGIEVVPMLDEKRHAFLFDLYVSGKWVGSRRTPDQCAEHLSNIIGLTIEPTAGTPW